MISVNGVAVTDINFNSTTPAAPAGEVNLAFAKDGAGNTVVQYDPATSGSLPNAGGSSTTLYENTTPFALNLINEAGDFDILWFLTAAQKTALKNGDFSVDMGASIQNGLYAAGIRGRHLAMDRYSGRFRTDQPLKMYTNAFDGNPNTTAGYCSSFGGNHLGAYRNGNLGGVVVKLFGTGYAYILEMMPASKTGNGPGKRKLQHITFDCNTQGGATNGIVWNSIKGTQDQLLDVKVNYMDNAVFAIFKGDGANQEFLKFDKCSAEQCKIFLYMDNASGQAYETVLRDCNCQMAVNAEACFKIGSSNGGYGLQVYNFNTSGIGQSGSAGESDAVFLKLAGSSDAIVFKGGRLENISSLFEYVSSPSTPASVLFENLTFAALHSSVAKPFIKSTANMGAGSTVTWRNCNIQSPADTTSYPAFVPFCDIAGTDSTRYRFEDCELGKTIITKLSNANAGFEIVNCIQMVKTADGQTNLGPIPYERHYSSSGRAPLSKRQSKDGSSHLAAGMPSNLLIQPSIGTTFGTNVTAGAPWVHFGTATNLALLDGNIVSNVQHGPNERQVRIKPSSGIYQDIPSVTLAANVPVFYQGQFIFSAQAGTSILTISLEDTAGNVLDKVQISSGATPGPVTISLVGVPLAAGGNPRLKFENLDTVNNFIFNLYWQFLSMKGAAAFYAPKAGTTYDSVVLWDANIPTARITGRLSLPHKSDATGSGASALADVESDIYLSDADERINYFADFGWSEIPRAKYVAALKPTSGTFNVNDELILSTPVGGAARRSVCTVAGTQGTLSGVTGSISVGTPTLTLAGTTANVKKGQYLTVPGAVIKGRVISLAGVTATLDSNATATVSGVAVSFAPGTFYAETTLAPAPL